MHQYAREKRPVRTNPVIERRRLSLTIKPKDKEFSGFERSDIKLMLESHGCSNLHQEHDYGFCVAIHCFVPSDKMNKIAQWLINRGYYRIDAIDTDD